MQTHETGDQYARHAAEEKRRRENAAATAEAVAGDCGDEFGHEQHRGDFPGEIAGERVGQVVVTEREYAQPARAIIEHRHCEHPGDEAAQCGLRPRWQ